MRFLAVKKLKLMFLQLLSTCGVAGGPWLPPHGGGACTSDWNCSLGGECSSAGTCACDPWWTGRNCTYLNLQRAKPDAGFRPPGYHSWGGHAAFDAASGLWRGFFSFMVRRCDLNSWTTNSATVQATAKEIDGPYTLLGDVDPDSLAPGMPALLVQPWSHNTYLVHDPHEQQYLVWHIGSGQVPPSQWKNCSGDGAPPAGASADHFSYVATSAARRRLRLDPGSSSSSSSSATAAPTKPLDGRGFFVATSPSLTGPWNVSERIQVEVDIPASGYWADPGNKGNPAPFIFPNGSALLFFSSASCPPDWPGALAPSCIGMATAPSWRGPYRAVGTLPITSPESEDPSVFRDPRGNFHLLTNVNNCHNHCAAGVACGGHAHSRDGLAWSVLHVGSFGPVITFENGTVYNAAYVERPQVVQDPSDGTPLGFFVGTGIGTYSNSVSWAQKLCTADMMAKTPELCGPTAAAPPS